MDSTVNCDVTFRAEKRIKRERLGTRLDERLIWRKKISAFKKYPDTCGRVFPGLEGFS